MKPNAYFDVCGTLFNVNTTFDFICFVHIRKHNFIKYIYCKLMISFFGKVLHKIIKFSLREKFLSTIIGIPKLQLYELAELYIECVIKENKNDVVFEFFLESINMNNTILISASIDPVISSLAKKYNLKFFSSELNYDDDGLCTGSLFNDLKGNKKFLLDVNTVNALFCSDNYDDLNCAACVLKYYYVIPLRKKRRINLPYINNLEVIYV